MHPEELPTTETRFLTKPILEGVPQVISVMTELLERQYADRVFVRKLNNSPIWAVCIPVVEGNEKDSLDLLAEIWRFLRNNGVEPVKGFRRMTWVTERGRGTHTATAFALLVDPDGRLT